MEKKNFIKKYDLSKLENLKNSTFRYDILSSNQYSSKKINILSLDGGGTRGIFILEILKNLCVNLYGNSDEIATKKFVQKFDLIAGTSTGAIIGIGLSIGYSINEIIKMYYEMMDNIFYKSWMLFPYRLYRYARTGDFYDQKALTELFKTKFKNKKISDIGSNIFVTTVNATETTWNPFIFRSYTSRNDLIDGATDGYIHDILTAATAAPLYFGPTYYNLKNINFEHSGISQNGQLNNFGLSKSNNILTLIDGGCCVNNPTELAIFEALSIYPNFSLGTILSIGSGTPKPDPNSFHLWNIIYNFVDVATNSEETNLNILRWINSKYLNINYFRFSTPNLGSLRLDDTNKIHLENGTILTDRYMKTQKEEVERLKKNIRK